MSIAGYVIILLVVGLLVFLVYTNVASSGTKDAYTVISGSIPGDKQKTVGPNLPRSFNESEGAVYSFTGWILINDYTSGFGTKRVIFSKGQDGPSVSLDTTSNSLVIAIKTYGATETILVQNLPALKWIHLGLVVDQYSVDVYINGTLKQHHTLAQLPDLNDEPILAGGGWDGVLGDLVYYPKKITSNEIHALANKKPPSDLKRPTSGPQYFDMTWYIGRLNSS